MVIMDDVYVVLLVVLDDYGGGLYLGFGFVLEENIMVFVSGYYYLMFSIDGVQEDYDFYIKVFGFYLVK